MSSQRFDQIDELCHEIPRDIRIWGTELAKYTGIIYFHGIGNQRRYEEMSRLVDALDAYSQTQDLATVGAPRGQRLEREVSNVSDAKDSSGFVDYLGFQRRIYPQGQKPKMQGSFKVFEGYWSSIVAKGLSSATVLKWLFKRWNSPIKSLRAPWRAHQRLKLAYLFRLYREEKESENPNKRLFSVYEGLADAYHEYNSSEAIKSHTKGSFESFKSSFIDTCSEISANDKAEAKRVAKLWRDRFCLSQWRIQFALLTFVFGIIGLFVALLFGTAPHLTNHLLGMVGLESFAKSIPQLLPAVWSLGLSAAVLFLAGITRYALRNFVADIVFWTAREGQSDLYESRLEIRESAVNTIQHALLDDDCERLIIIAHSLGTSVAYEALLELGRRRDAIGKTSADGKKAYPYEKISHFITAGSPIETIHYFFDLINSPAHRYNRVADTLKGSSEDHPFRMNGHRNIEWINLHAAADPVSSELYLPARKRIPDIQEIEVVSQFEPDPAAAHSGYFKVDTAVAHMFEAVFKTKTNTITHPATNPLDKRLARTFVYFLWFWLVVIAWSLFATAGILLLDIWLDWAWLGTAAKWGILIAGFGALIPFLAWTKFDSWAHWTRRMFGSGIKHVREP